MIPLPQVRYEGTLAIRPGETFVGVRDDVGDRFELCQSKTMLPEGSGRPYGLRRNQQPVAINLATCSLVIHSGYGVVPIVPKRGRYLRSLS